MSIWGQFRVKDEDFPRFVEATQHFDDTHIEDLPARVNAEFARHQACFDVKGKRIAVCVGSRGIWNLDQIVRATVDNLKALGAEVYIDPTMGSHGEGTDNGQKDVLVHLGITEQAMGCPVISKIATQFVGNSKSGHPVYVAESLLEADGVFPIVRIKTHTSFRGDYESGFLKMMVVGMGKVQGAGTFHAAGFEQMAINLIEMAKVIQENIMLVGGVGFIENAYDHTFELEVFTPQEIWDREPGLLLKSKSMMPRIPFDDIDIMIIHELGKNISGDGMDPNIIGCYSPDTMHPDYTRMPRIKRLMCLNLTRETHGHAPGIGFLTCIPERMCKEIDFERTYLNALIAAVDCRGAKMPMICPDERTCLEAVFRTLAQIPPKHMRICIIRNTLCLDDMVVSEPMIGTQNKNINVNYSNQFMRIAFDKNNDIKFVKE